MPQKVNTSKQPCQFSEYQTKYKQNEKVPRGPIVRPEDVIKNEGEVDYNTTHKEKFPAHQVKTRSEYKPQGKYVKNTAPMELDTEYGTNYLLGQQGEHYPLPDFYKQKTQPYGDGRDRIKKSVTQKDFDPKSLGEKPVIHKLQDNVMLSDDPFDGTTTHQADFTRFQKLPAKTGRRPDNIDNKGLPVTYETTNKEHFVPYKNQQRHHKMPTQHYQPNEKPFNGKSLMKSDYKHHSDAEKSEMVKFDNSFFHSDQPLDQETTHQSMYKGWEVQKRQVPLDKPAYTRPAGKMDFNKTSDDYQQYGKVASRTMRPKTNINFGDEFDSKTSYNDGYIKHDYVREKATHRERDYYTSGVPFESTSESKDNYKRFNTAPSKPVNRDNELFDKNVPFTDHTSYGAHFHEKKLPQCPSLAIVANNFAGYKVKDDFATGHRFLIPDKSSRGSVQSPPLPPINGQQRYVAVQ